MKKLIILLGVLFGLLIVTPGKSQIIADLTAQHLWQVETNVLNIVDSSIIVTNRVSTNPDMYRNYQITYNQAGELVSRLPLGQAGTKDQAINFCNRNIARLNGDIEFMRKEYNIAVAKGKYFIQLKALLEAQ